jgi:methylated-DNA-[protein]-cysteine S-methyltransferase
MSLDKKIYKKLLELPEGKITTYGELAKAVGFPNGQRAVGKFMNKNPYPVIIPCHRVVKADGKVGGYAFGEEIKTNMLKKEGIRVKDGKILDWENAIYRF